MMSFVREKIAEIRKDYSLKSLSKEDLAHNPYEQFQTWFSEAIKSEILEPNAMTLSTASKDGIPSSRVVLLKGFDERGFVFYTNYNSKKGQELAQNPNASLNFFWKELERQVIISGVVERVSPEESDEYFKSRPLPSRLGAWASAQSEVIENSLSLIKKFKDFEMRYFLGDVPRPPHWGGFRVIPNSIEFWQGRPSRLHDRFRYTHHSTGWRIDQLSP
ncbi:MAG: pyridoxamine 5'-phosphate oxidase [Chloroherpetonaceae bacterium]|nr:pyridoxamine 5'-phosphate oxidase [Chloroherpetonaceae bacterium]